MLNLLKEKNNDIRLYSVEDSEFASFGRIIKNIDVAEIVAAAKKFQTPKAARRICRR